MSACGENPILTDPYIAVFVTPVQSTVAIGDTVRLLAQVLGRATPRQVLWSTSAPAIASVDSGGLVRGMADGQATITATDTQDRNVKASAFVTSGR